MFDIPFSRIDNEGVANEGLRELLLKIFPRVNLRFNTGDGVLVGCLVFLSSFGLVRIFGNFINRWRSGVNDCTDWRSFS